MQIVDPHVHFFALQEGRYEWLKPHNPPFWPDKPVLCCDGSDQDLQGPGLSLKGVVHIEAGFDNARPWREVQYLEHHVRVPLRTIAGYDLLAADPQVALAHLLPLSSVVGVRHILDEDAQTVLQASRTLAHFNALARHHLLFEAQLAGTDTAGINELARCLQQSGVRCVVNHAAFAPVDKPGYTLWHNNMAQLAQNPQVAVKVSGFEMLSTQRHWDAQFATRVMDDLLSLFGPQRVMLASNFPLCRFAHSWQQLWAIYQRCVAPECQPALFADTAWQWYRFSQ